LRFSYDSLGSLTGLKEYFRSGKCSTATLIALGLYPRLDHQFRDKGGHTLMDCVRDARLASRRVGLSLVLIAVMSLTMFSFVFGSTHTGFLVGEIGTATLSAANFPPEVSDLQVGTTNVTTVNVGTLYTWFLFVRDKNSVNDLESVTIFVHSINGIGGVFDERGSYGYRWLRGDIWQELTATGWSNTTTYLNTAQSNHTQISSKVGYGEWEFAVTLPEKALQYKFSYHWVLEGEVRDRAGADGLRSILFDINPYVSLQLDGKSPSWFSY
jgi:hypothetical protein